MAAWLFLLNISGGVLLPAQLCTLTFFLSKSLGICLSIPALHCSVCLSLSWSGCEVFDVIFSRIILQLTTSELGGHCQIIVLTGSPYSFNINSRSSIAFVVVVEMSTTRPMYFEGGVLSKSTTTTCPCGWHVALCPHSECL